MNIPEELDMSVLKRWREVMTYKVIENIEDDHCLRNGLRVFSWRKWAVEEHTCGVTENLQERFCELGQDELGDCKENLRSTSPRSREITIVEGS
ncbi:hypothetical protein ACEPAG_2933 [Sanghuangporus baumii]